MDIFFDTYELEQKLTNNINEINIIDKSDNSFIEINLDCNNKLTFNCNCLNRKCLHVTNFLNYLDNKYQNNSISDQYIIEKKIDFPIKSESDESLYLVSFYDNNKNIDYRCSCGLKFGRGYRKKCKHIKNTINQIKLEYEESINECLDGLVEKMTIN